METGLIFSHYELLARKDSLCLTGTQGFRKRDSLSSRGTGSGGGTGPSVCLLSSMYS